jgi:uncharacterized protein YdiU (UPF0061 family)
MKLVARYTQIADDFAVADQPSAVIAPNLLLWNDTLARQLNIEVATSERAVIFSGNLNNSDVAAVALGYSGHQFGHFSPRLGDGRAHLLGAVTDQQQQLWDIQLKGSGATPFSRGGDGRCAIGPAVREYIMSEAMHGLGIPTTRCLAVVASGETVYRQPPQQGAIVTRVASSHIRVGSFQYLAAQGDVTGLKTLADLAIERHYPEIKSTGSARYLAFLTAVIEKQVSLIVSWMRVGFIHGVMNTDNTLVSGETIDYGPCAMMNQFDFDTVFSDDEEQAVELLSPLINGFAEQFHQAFTQMWAKKLGFDGHQDGDAELVSELLTLLKTHQLDYTNTFDSLTESLQGQTAIPSDLAGWSIKWLARTNTQSYQLMRQANPRLIPRNHIVESIIQQYESTGESSMLDEYLTALRSPYQLLASPAFWYSPPVDMDTNYQTFCGT